MAEPTSTTNGMFIRMADSVGNSFWITAPNFRSSTPVFVSASGTLTQMNFLEATFTSGPTGAGSLRSYLQAQARVADPIGSTPVQTMMLIDFESTTIG
jgi:hypothetical protein